MSESESELGGIVFSVEGIQKVREALINMRDASLTDPDWSWSKTALLTHAIVYLGDYRVKMEKEAQHGTVTE